MRLLLWIAACTYSLVIRLRNTLYCKGFLKAHSANAAVISIGNITAGGTGKTPLVIWLCNQLSQNYKCAILTRGYRAAQNSKLKTQDFFDEPAILAENCPDAMVIVNPDRVAGAAEAVSRFGARVLIMDDGFHHRRLARDLDIVAIDATRPFGYGRILPAGLLREPAAALRRADVVVITRSDQAAEAQLTRLEHKIRHIDPNMVMAKSIHAPTCVEYAAHSVIPAQAEIQKTGETTDSSLRNSGGLEQLKGKKIFAFCGIGHPDAFFNTIKNLRADLVGSKIFDDHHYYTDACLAEIREQAARLDVDLVLTTQKDWTKIGPLLSAEKRPPFAYLAIEIRFSTGEDKLRRLIEDTLAGKISQQ